MANSKTTKWFIIYLVLYSLLELSKGEICPDCGNDFISVKRYRWRCKGKLHNTHTTAQGNHENDILHRTIENPPNSLVSLNNDIDSNHGEGHLTSYDENKNKNKSDNDFTCYCGKKCKGLRGLIAHQPSCVASNLDDLQTNYADDEPMSPQQEKIPVKDAIKLPTTKEECETANVYFHANLDLHSDIIDNKNEVLMFQSCIYDYFRLIEKSKNPDHTRNSLFTEYNNLS